MRIALASQEYPPDTAHGGIGTQTFNKARWLAARGDEVHVISCLAGPGTAECVTLEAGVHVHRLPPPGTAFPVYTDAAYWIGYTWTVLAGLHALLRTGPLDLIDFAEYGGEGYAYLLDRTPWNWAPVVVQLHGPLSLFADRIGWPEPQSDLARVGIAMEDFCMRRADALMACSANIADHTAARHGVPRDAIAVVHCGVDDRAFRPRTEPRPAGARPTVLFAGNLVRSKGAGAVFDACLRLRERYPDLLLRLAGKPEGELVESMRSRMRRGETGDAVELCGFIGREGLEASYREADIFCAPSQHECGVANVYIEAMASGLPVIASDSGGGAEAVVPGETGLLVPPLDVDALVVALDRLLGDAAERARMGAAGSVRAREHFAMDRYMARVLGVYARAAEVAARRKAEREQRELG